MKTLVALLLCLFLAACSSVIESLEDAPTPYPPANLPILVDELPLTPPPANQGMLPEKNDFSAQFSQEPGYGCPIAAEISEGQFVMYDGFVYYEEALSQSGTNKFYLWCVVADIHDGITSVPAAEMWAAVTND